MKISPIIVLVVLFAGCMPALQNKAAFDNPICPPPCWQNITPGITTKKDALNILSKISFVDQPVIDMSTSSMGFEDQIRFSAYTGSQRHAAGSIFISGDRVVVIAFETHLGTMQKAIDLFGDPEYILVVQTGFFDEVTLLNTSKGISFAYKLFGYESLAASGIEPNTEIDYVIFYDPNQFQAILNSKILSAYTLDSDGTKKFLRPWTGYGSFKEKYWPPATPSSP